MQPIFLSSSSSPSANEPWQDKTMYVCRRSFSTIGICLQNGSLTDIAEVKSYLNVMKRNEHILFLTPITEYEILKK